MSNGMQIPIPELKKLANKRIFAKALIGREPYVFREPLRDDRGVVVGFNPKKIIGVSYQYVVLVCPAPKKLVITGRATGKTGVMIGDDAPHAALIQPYFDGAWNFLDRPLPTKIVVVGNLRDTSRRIQEQMRRDILDNEWMNRLVSEHTQTYMLMRNGSETFIKTSGNDGSSVRGLHGEILTNQKNQTVKAVIRFYLDELAFSRARNLLREVVEPILMLNPRSSVQVTTTPYGEEGEVYDAWKDATSMDCMQEFSMESVFVERMTDDGVRYYREEPFRVYKKFDTDVCHRCLSVRGYKRFNVATADNPFVVPELLYNQKRTLLANGLSLVWNQEHMGLFQKSAGRFFPPSVWLKMIDDDVQFFDEITDIVEYPTQRRGTFYLGIDSSSGIATKGSDFCAIALWEAIGQPNEEHFYLRHLRRWQVPPEVWRSKAYVGDKDLLLFVVDFIVMLYLKILINQVSIGFGFGQGIFVGLRQKDVTSEYFTDSEQEMAAGFTVFRALGALGRIHLPPEVAEGGSHEWLTQESGWLGIGAAATGLHFKAYKTPGWGTGKTVDGLFACMYGLMPVIKLMIDDIGGVASSSMVSVPTPREVGQYGYRSRELSIAGAAGMRPLSKN